jgi:glutamate racemase
VKPIAVFDSGVGGLTVLKVLRSRFPDENFVYLGDTARLPYGSKNPKTIRLYLEQCLNFLNHYDPKAFVVACNSASTQVTEDQWMGKPIFNVIDPVVSIANQSSQTQRIGVIGTRATVQSQVFSKKLLDLNGAAHITEQECPLFVPLAEEGWVDDPITNLIAFRYLEKIRKAQVDSLILGCTHYPILAHSIQKAVGFEVQLIEAGPAIANLLQETLLIRTNENSDTVFESTGELKILVTDSSKHLNLWALNLLGLPDQFQIEWVHL